MMTEKEVELPDGSVVGSLSKEYITYCEALSLSKKPLGDRVRFLDKLTDVKRVEKLKYYLTAIWDSKKKQKYK